jgi:Cu/Ag efflux pump CusA
VGFINLFGLAVLNGILLVSYMNKLREDGYSLDDAVTSGALLRLRPVLMTALVALLGLLHHPYAIYYQVSGQELIIVRVLHGARDSAAIPEQVGFLQ